MEGMEGGWRGRGIFFMVNGIFVICLLMRNSELGMYV